MASTGRNPEMATSIEIASWKSKNRACMHPKYMNMVAEGEDLAL